MVGNQIKIIFLLFLMSLQAPLYAKESNLYFMLPKISSDFLLHSDLIIKNTEQYQTNLQINAYDSYGLSVPIDSSVSKLDASEVRAINTTIFPPNVASLHIITDNSVEGNLSVWNVGGNQSITIPSLGFGLSQLSFPFVVDSNFSYKYLMILNPNDEYVVASVSGVDRNGQQVTPTYLSSATIIINPKQTKTIALSEIFDISSSITTVRFAAEKHLVGYELTYDPSEITLEVIPTIEEFTMQNSSTYIGMVGDTGLNQGFPRNSHHYSLAANSATYKLALLKSGTGTGKVTGTGIDCGKDCSESYNAGTSVALSVNADANSDFTNWSGGGCSGNGSCNVVMSSAKTVTAKFTLKPNLPDLAMLSVTAPTKGIAGKTISLSATVANIGESGASAFTLEFYLSPDNIITPLKLGENDFTKEAGGGDLKLGGCSNYPALSPNAANGCRGSFLIPARKVVNGVTSGVASGRYYIGAYVDGYDINRNDIIVEISETNNGKSATSSTTITSR
jgi:hypothetical protein